MHFYFVKRNLGKNFPFCRNSFRVRVLRFISYYSSYTVFTQPAINTSRQPHSQKKKSPNIITVKESDLLQSQKFQLQFCVFLRLYTTRSECVYGFARS